MAFKMKGVKHFTKDKEEWNGATHKMDDGTLHTGKTHNKKSEKLFHKGDSALKKRGLWDNIHAKRNRIKAGSGEKMRKKGDKGAPSAKNLKESQS